MKPKTTRRHFLCIASSVLLTISYAHATSLYWDVNGNGTGFSTVVGTWDTTNNFWNDNSAGTGGTLTNTTTSADDLIIQQATINTGNITVTGTQNASSITFAANVGPTANITTNTIAIGGTGASSGVFQQSSGANTISSALTLNSTVSAFNFSNSSTGLLTLGTVTGSAAGLQAITAGSSSSGGIALGGAITDGGGGGNVGLTINSSGSGLVTLTGANTYTGTTLVSAGVLNIQNASALGSTTAGTSVTSGAALQIQGGITTGAEPLTLDGTGISATGALRNISGTNTYAGLVTLGGATRINSDASLQTLTLSNVGTITGATFGLTVGGAGNTTINSIIGTTSGTLTKDGAGTLSLSGANTYTGGTSVTDGGLVFRNTASKEATGTHDFVGGTTLGLGVGGTGFFSATDVTNAFAGTMSGNLSNVTVTPTTNVGIDTSAGDFTYSTNVAGSPTKGLIKYGANKLTLSGNNTYTGGFTLNAGTVEFAPPNGSYFGFGTGTLTINGGTIRTSTNAQFTTANNSVWNAGFSVDRGSTGTRIWTHNGNVTLGGNVAITTALNSWTTVVNGTVDETGGSRSLTVTTTGPGNNTITLAGANTYSGGTTLATAGSNLNINNSGSGGTSSAIGTGTLTIAGGIINNTSGSAVTLSTNNTVNTTATVAFTGTNSLNLGTGALSLNGARTFTITANTLTIGSIAATGGHGIVKGGAGTLVVSGNNLATGNNTINTGALNIRNNGSLGSGGGLTLVNSGGALEFQGGLTGVNESLSLNGTGVSDGGALRNISGNNTLTGLATLFSATRINSDSGTLTLDRPSGNAVTGTFNLTLGGAGDIAIADPVATGTGTLTKDGAGTATLSATNTYTGATTVSGGTLALGASDVFADTTAVSIGNATLNAVTFNDTLGTLDATGNAVINLGTGAALAFADSDAVDWTSGTLNVTGTLGATSLRFGTDSTGLSLAQLALISVNGAGLGSYVLDPSGYLIAGSGGSGFDTWKTTNSAGVQTLADDHDNDGVDNGTEYFIGGPSGNTTGFTALPGVTNTLGTLSVTWTKATSYTGAYTTDFVVETSATLTGPWTPAVLGTGPDQVVISGNSVTYTFPAGTKNFARLKVTGP